MTFEKLLEEDGKLVYRTRGVSMEPMLRQNRDLVVIEVPSSRLKKYDVALYRRGTSYVLHRVIGVKSDHYLIRGDNVSAKGEEVFRYRPGLPVLCPRLGGHLSPPCSSGQMPGTRGGNRPKAGAPAAAQTPASKEK